MRLKGKKQSIYRAKRGPKDNPQPAEIVLVKEGAHKSMKILCVFGVEQKGGK